jgi:hypothetical protein
MNNTKNIPGLEFRMLLTGFLTSPVGLQNEIWRHKDACNLPPPHITFYTNNTTSF